MAEKTIPVRIGNYMYFKYLSTGLLPVFILKLLIIPTSLSDGFVAVALIALYAFSCYLENKKEIPINEATKTKLALLENEIKEIKGTLTAFKLSSQVRLK